MALAKGSTLRATLDFVRNDQGAAALARVLARLPDERRRDVERAATTDEVPFDLALDLWRAADMELGAADPAWIERAGAQSIESFGVQLYGGILRKASPTEFLTQSVSLFQLYYSPGNMEVVESEPGRAVLRLVGFDAADPLFCRRQTGGLRRAVGLAGGADAVVRHVRCAAPGDAFCEWELRWR
ncbi:MAG TPA: hypothetical protein VF771_04975 [Longimicrobiaceae bacterium]